MMKAKIEITKGTKLKPELHEESGQEEKLHAEAPGYYGYLIGTESEEGDPKDVVVFTDKNLEKGEEVEVDVLGYIEMTDEGNQDNKYFASTGTHVEYKQVLQAKDFIAHYKKHQGDEVEFGHVVYT